MVEGMDEWNLLMIRDYDECDGWLLDGFVGVGEWLGCVVVVGVGLVVWFCKWVFVL